jgi:hypothetical protein
MDTFRVISSNDGTGFARASLPGQDRQIGDKRQEENGKKAMVGGMPQTRLATAAIAVSGVHRASEGFNYGLCQGGLRTASI